MRSFENNLRTRKNSRKGAKARRKSTLRLCTFACIFLFASATNIYCQEIKKMKITELETYIRQSDHPLIINFWATFCVPCVKEIPAFQSAIEKNKDVELLLVSLDLPSYYPQKISSFAKEKNFNASIAWLNETNADYFCPKIDKKWSGAIPSSLFVNNKTKFRLFFEREMTGKEVDQVIESMTK
jgi:thiol-disulfide isomerase/thioredoxin